MAAAKRSTDRLGLAAFGLTEEKGTDLMHAPLERARRRPGEAGVAREGTEPRGRERPPKPSPRPCGNLAEGASSSPVTGFPGPLLLVEKSLADRACLQRGLMAHGFAIIGVESPPAALAAAAEAGFAYAVLELRLGGGSGLELIRQLRERHAAMRIVVVTDHDSFASVVLALRAGADDYLAKPVAEAELTDALLGRAPTLPPVPETPLGLQRVCWEHIQRILAQCDRNVSETARRLGMGRRSLQRILSKRAPYRRGLLQG
jgi:two-component system, response regulator RegA